MATPERPILEWAQREAARLVAVGPKDRAAHDAGDGTDGRRRIEERRGRVIDAYVDGAISKVERDRRLRQLDEEAEKIAAQTVVEAIPGAIDWTWKPADINGVLKAMWQHVELDDDLHPVRAEWTRPEWRAA